MPVPAEVGRERKAEALPKASVAVARAGFERVLAASVARGFDNRGFATAAAQAAFALHDIGDADIASAALGAYASALRNAGMGTAGVVFTDARVGRNLPRQWFARCARSSPIACARAEYVVLEFDVDADGETRDVIVVETSDRRFGQFVQRRLSRGASPVRMLPLDTQEAAPQTRKARYFWSLQIRPRA